MPEEEQQKILQALRDLIAATKTLMEPMSRYKGGPLEMAKDFSVHNLPTLLDLIAQIENYLTKVNS